jgi:hypothetical protein
MMIENVHDIRKITSELNSDNAVLREQLIKMDTAFNLRLAQIERYSQETTIRQEQNLKKILKEKFEILESQHQSQLEDYADVTMNTLMNQRLLQFEENFKFQNGQTGTNTQDSAPENDPDDSSSSDSNSSSSSSDSSFDSNPGKSRTKKHKKIKKKSSNDNARDQNKKCAKLTQKLTKHAHMMKLPTLKLPD